MNRDNIKTEKSWLVPAAIIVGTVMLVALFIWNDNRKTSAVNTTAVELDALVNQPAPNFTLSGRSGETYTLENLRGKKIILFFNEGLICYPACWDQMISLSKDKRFQSDDIVALSVVVDKKEQWEQAVAKMEKLGSVKVAFDELKEASRAFSVLSVPSSMHFGSLPGHTYVILDREGVVRFVLDDPKMAINNDRLMAELEKLH